MTNKLDCGYCKAASMLEWIANKWVGVISMEYFKRQISYVFFGQVVPCLYKISHKSCIFYAFMADFV